jgi:hypothetical protein
MHFRAATSGFITALAASLFAARAPAEVTRIDVETRADVADGAAYGLAGAYEKIAGRLHFAVDPELPANAIIRDIGYAAVNDRGLVEFSADFYLLKPKDIAHANGALLFEVSNRGRKGMLPMLELARGSLDPESPAELGDGLLLRNGFTLLWVGWQFDVPDEPDILRVFAPVAGSAAAPVRASVRSDFIVRSRAPSQSLADRGHRAYPALALNNPADTMTVRDTPNGTRRVIPRSAWRFARVEGGREIPDAAYVTLDGGFEANRIYEVVYESENPPIAGTGFAAIRDAVSRLKHDGADELGLPQGSLSRSIAFGISQSGRVLRAFLYEGFNADEGGRKVFDGVIAHIAGGARGSFNHRFAQPSRASWSYHHPHAMFPFTDAQQTDPSTGASDGLLAAIPAAAMPKVFHTNSSNEYWRGIAALTHVSPDGSRDVAPPDNVRLYFLAGTQHVPAAFPPVRSQGQQPGNPNEYAWFLRKLVLAMDDWIRGRAEPPPSRYPTLEQGTLIERGALAFPRIPSVNVPREVAAAQRIDYGPDFASAGIIREPPVAGAAYPALIPQVDADGNETSGLVSPELAVPLATLTGWNLFDPSFGPEHELVSLQGSYIPFALKARQRDAAADPRPSIEERYSSRAQYIGLITVHALGLVDAGYLLAEDLAAIIERAGEHWDQVVGTGL